MHLVFDAPEPVGRYLRGEPCEPLHATARNQTRTVEHSEPFIPAKIRTIAPGNYDAYAAPNSTRNELPGCYRNILESPKRTCAAIHCVHCNEARRAYVAHRRRMGSVAGDTCHWPIGGSADPRSCAAHLTHRCGMESAAGCWRCTPIRASSDRCACAAHFAHRRAMGSALDGWLQGPIRACSA